MVEYKNTYIEVTSNLNLVISSTVSSHYILSIGQLLGQCTRQMFITSWGKPELVELVCVILYGYSQLYGILHVFWYFVGG